MDPIDAIIKFKSDKVLRWFLNVWESFDNLWKVGVFLRHIFLFHGALSDSFRHVDEKLLIGTSQ